MKNKKKKGNKRARIIHSAVNRGLRGYNVCKEENAMPLLLSLRTHVLLRERKNGRKSDEKIAGTCGGHLRLALSVRAKMETAERAPGRTIDVGKPNESNRTRAFGGERKSERTEKAKERTEDRGRQREEYLASPSSKQKL